MCQPEICEIFTNYVKYFSLDLIFVGTLVRGGLKEGQNRRFKRGPPRNEAHLCGHAPTFHLRGGGKKTLQDISIAFFLELRVLLRLGWNE
jgi:hypothetical protein